MSSNDPFIIDEFQLDLGFSDEEIPTSPLWGMRKDAIFLVEDKYEPLFTSATWTLIATVDGIEVSRSSQARQARTGPFIKRWTRALLRQKKVMLERLGVDVESEYLNWGGDIFDLSP